MKAASQADFLQQTNFSQTGPDEKVVTSMLAPHHPQAALLTWISQGDPASMAGNPIEADFPLWMLP